MQHRLYRSHATSARAQRIDSLMLPAVTILLLLGAAFVVSAWSEAGDLVDSAERKDEIRADRLAASVDELLDRRALELLRWSQQHGDLLARGRKVDLERELDGRVEAGSVTAQVAWLV